MSRVRIKTVIACSVVLLVLAAVFIRLGGGGGEFTASLLALEVKAAAGYADMPEAVRGTDIRINLDGKFKPLSEPVLIVRGRTYLPLRALGELIEATTFFDAVNGIAAQRLGGVTVETFSGSPYLIVNGADVLRVDEGDHDQRAFAWHWNDRMYLPVRQICEVLGFNVLWDGNNGIIYIASAGKDPVFAADITITIEELTRKMAHIADHDRQIMAAGN
jgi:hypothetical protein